MADVVVTNDVDTFLRSADNAAARTNLEVYSDAEVDAKVATKAVPGGVEFNGGYITLSQDASIFGNTISFRWKMKVVGTPTASDKILEIGTSNNFGINFYTSTQIGFFFRASAANGRYVWTFPSDEKIHDYCLVYDPSDLSSPTLYIDSVSADRSTFLSPSGTALVPSGPIYFMGPTDNPNVVANSLLFFNRALSASEVAELYESGTVAVEDRWGKDYAFGTSTNPAAFTLDSFTATSTTVSASDSTDGGRFVLPVTNDWQSGQFITLDVDVTALTGTIQIAGCVDETTGSAGSIDSSKSITSTGRQQITVQKLNDVVNVGLLFLLGAGEAIDMTIYGVRIEGAIADLPLDEGTGTKFYDRSPNNYNATGSDTGITHLLPIEPRDERERLGVTAQLNTKETAGGASLINVGNGGIIVSTTAGEPIAIGSVYSVSLMLKINRVSSSGHVFIFGENSNNRGGLQVLSAGQIQFGERINGVSSTQCPRTNYEIGKWFHVVCVANSGNYELYIDGVLATNVATYGLLGAVTGFRFGNGTIASDLGRDIEINSAKIFNRALTATEVQDLHDTNTVAVSDRWGNPTPVMDASTLNGGFESAGAGGADVFANWIESASGTSAITRDTVEYDTGAASCKIVTDGSNSSAYVYQAILTAGKKYRVTLRAKGGGTATNEKFNAQIGLGAGGFIFNGQAVTTSWQTFTGEGIAVGVDLVIGRNATGDAGQTLYFDGVTIEEIGAIADLPLDEGIGYQFHDRSSNHFDALASTSGVTHLVPKTEGYIRDFNVDAYNGGSGNVALITSTQAITPPYSVPSYMMVKNQNASAAVSGTLALNKTTTALTPTVCDVVTLNMAAGAGFFYNGFSIDAADASGISRDKMNITVTASDSDATNLDIRVDYKCIETPIKDF